MKYALLATALASTLLLTACEPDTVSATTTINRLPNGDTSAGVSITATWKNESDGAWKGAARMMGTSGAPAIDVSQMALELTGSNAQVLDGTGTGLVAITRDGVLLGQRSFAFVVQGGIAVAANPSEVNAWLAGYPDANGYDVSVTGLQSVAQHEGQSTLTSNTIYDGDVVASASTSWGSDAPPGGCDGGGDPDYPSPIIVCP
jgi:hypothetical protein